MAADVARSPRARSSPPPWPAGWPGSIRGPRSARTPRGAGRGRRAAALLRPGHRGRDQLTRRRAGRYPPGGIADLAASAVTVPLLDSVEWRWRGDVMAGSRPWTVTHEDRSKGWLWTREVVSLPARSQDASADLEWQWTLRADGSVVVAADPRAAAGTSTTTGSAPGSWTGPPGRRSPRASWLPADYLETIRPRPAATGWPCRGTGTAQRGKCPACGALAGQERRRHAAAHQRPSAGLAGPVRSRALARPRPAGEPCRAGPGPARRARP